MNNLLSRLAHVAHEADVAGIKIVFALTEEQVQTLAALLDGVSGVNAETGELMVVTASMVSDQIKNAGAAIFGCRIVSRSE